MKQIFTTALVLSGVIAYTQTEEDFYKRVGINTTQPRAGLEVKAYTFDGRAQGVLLPHISNDEKKKWQPNDIIGLVAGTVIWNTDKNCLDYFDGNKWQCADGSNPDYPIINTTPNKSVKADVWDRTHYIGSFNHNGANIDGVLDNTTNKLTLQIPYNQATVGGSYNEINVKRTVKDRNGKNVLLTLNIPAGTFAAAKGFLTATIKVGNGSTDTYSVKYLSANTEETIAEYVFSINGNVSDVKLVASGGVLDKNFGQTNYNLIYVPVSAYHILVETIPDTGAPYEGKWLNNNLGANYANRDKPSDFNPVKQAQANDDYRAYGSLFEWQRPADGHELVNWTSSTTGDFTETEETLWTSTDWKPNHSRFIIGKLSLEDVGSLDSWVVQNVNLDFNFFDLWQKDGANNPCPSGYHVPMRSEWESLHHNLVSQGTSYWSTQSQLHLSATGQREDIFGDYAISNDGVYWSSTGAGGYTFTFYYDSTKSRTYGELSRAAGAPIRCVAN